MHKKLANDTKKKVYNLIGGMFKDEYKKKNGNWNVSKIAKESGTSRNTVYKYITDFEAL
jgi:transcriptional regulator of acetoin/glycerol metabolism